MNKKILATVICVVVVGAAIGAYFAFMGGKPTEVVKGQVLTVGGFTDFKGGEEIKTNVFDTFLDVGETGRPQPGPLVESWEVSDNEKEYTFHLRQGVKFHDGTEWNSTTAKWFFEWLPNSGRYGTELLGKKIANVKTAGEYTIKVSLKEPYGAFLKDLTSTFKAEVIPPTAVKPRGSKEGEQVDFIGTGPFKVKEYTKGQKAILVKSEQYQGKEPKLDKIVYKVIPDPHSRVSALRAGDVDIIGATEHHAAVPYEEIPKLKKDPDIVVESKSYGRVQTLEFKCQNGPAANLKVRKAFNYGFDRQDMVEKLLAGAATPMSTILPPKFSFAKSLEGEGYPYTPEKSRELLSEAGWKDTDGDGIREKNGKELVLDYVVPKGEANARPIAVYLQDKLKNIGIKVNVKIMERGAASKAEEEGEYDLYLHHMSGVPGLPESPLTGIYWSENPDPGDKLKYHSDELDRLIEKGLATGKDEVFDKAFLHLQKNHACVPLYDIEKIVAHKKKVHYEFPQTYKVKIGSGDFSKVYLEEES